MTYCTYCNSLIVNDICSNKRCPSKDAALTSWVINGMLYRFKTPMTLSKAIELRRQGSSLILKQPSSIRENRNKVWLNSPTW